MVHLREDEYVMRKSFYFFIAVQASCCCSVFEPSLACAYASRVCLSPASEKKARILTLLCEKTPIAIRLPGGYNIDVPIRRECPVGIQVEVDCCARLPAFDRSRDADLAVDAVHPQCRFSRHSNNTRTGT